MAIDVKAQLAELFAAADKKTERYGELMPATDDVALVVLKGHLIIEEMLFEIAANHCSDPEELKKAKLSFAQVLHVTRALIKLPPHQRRWEAIALLNTLRNSLVHNLEPKEIAKKIEALDQMCKLDDEKLPEGFVKPTEPARIVAGAIHFIMGSLSVLNPVTALIERNLKLPHE